MQILRPFKVFDPINSQIEAPLPTVLNDIVYRARQFIKGRSLEEINYAASTNNYLFFLAEYGEFVLDNEKQSRQLNELGKNIRNKRISSTIFLIEFDSEPPKSIYVSAAQLLLEQIKISDILDQEYFPLAKWEEYLAVFALAAIGRLCWLFQRDGQITEETVRLAAVAIEAITIAEAPTTSIPALDEGYRQRISLKSRKNAIRQYEDLDDVKLEFKSFYDNDYLPSLGDESPVKQRAAEFFIRHHADPTALTALNKFDNPARILVDSLPVTPRPRTTR